MGISRPIVKFKAIDYIYKKKDVIIRTTSSGREYVEGDDENDEDKRQEKDREKRKKFQVKCVIEQNVNF